MIFDISWVLFSLNFTGNCKFTDLVLSICFIFDNIWSGVIAKTFNLLFCTFERDICCFCLIVHFGSYSLFFVLIYFSQTFIIEIVI